MIYYTKIILFLPGLSFLGSSEMRSYICILLWYLVGVKKFSGSKSHPVSTSPQTFTELAVLNPRSHHIVLLFQLYKFNVVIIRMYPHDIIWWYDFTIPLFRMVGEVLIWNFPKIPLYNALLVCYSHRIKPFNMFPKGQISFLNTWYRSEK